jgi:hypothetical protein
MKSILSRLSVDLLIFLVLGIVAILGLYQEMLPSQEGTLRSIFLYSLATLHWYVSRRAFIGKIDWLSEGDKWRKILALVMLVGSYLIYSKA